MTGLAVYQDVSHVKRYFGILAVSSPPLGASPIVSKGQLFFAKCVDIDAYNRRKMPAVHRDIFSIYLRLNRTRAGTAMNINDCGPHMSAYCPLVILETARMIVFFMSL